jgi:CheY-like chemotaxis protein
MRILLAEDEPMVSDRLVIILKAEGHSVVVEADGNAALQCFESAEFDLVITDLHMPNCDEPPLIKAVNAARPAQRVVLLTGTGGAYPLHFDHVLHKPVRASAIRVWFGDWAKKRALPGSIPGTLFGLFSAVGRG